jgi:hypothetical protein
MIMVGDAPLVCPFPGLRPFGYDDHHLFFGRTDDIDRLHAMLKRATRFVAVIGTSGCGKSSLVNAGLLPRLLMPKLSDSRRHWRKIRLRPLGSPTAQLASALVQLAREESFATGDRSHDLALAARYRAMLRRTTGGLVDVLREILPDEAIPVLVFIDQFEELFRYGPGESDTEAPIYRDEAQAFTNLLLDAAGAVGRGIHVLVTMRSDFFGECGRYRGLAEAVSANQFLVARMVREQLQLAITAPPCVAVGVASERWPEVIEPALVQRIVNDASDEATGDPLPVMQHALMRAWGAETRVTNGAFRIIGIDDYRTAGGIDRALDQHADEVMDVAMAAAGPPPARRAMPWRTCSGH